MDVETILHLANLLGVSAADLHQRAVAAADAANIAAVTAASTPDLPADAHALALLAEVVTGQRVMAVKDGGTKTMRDPSQPPTSFRPRNEADRFVTRPGYLLVTTGDVRTGNPIALEGWLREVGHLAMAINPVTCWVSAERQDAWKQEIFA